MVDTQMTRQAAILAAALLAMAVVGCSAAPAPSSSAPVPATAAPAAPAVATQAAPPNHTKLTIIYGGASPNLWGVYAAIDKGFFARYGVDVNLVTAQNSAQGVAAVIGGSAHPRVASAPTLMCPIPQGANAHVRPPPPPHRPPSPPPPPPHPPP